MNLFDYAEPYTLGELFSGIGGFSCGFAKHKIKSRWAVEISPECQQVFARHFAEAELYADIQTTDAGQLGRVDVISFGSPCQDLSRAKQLRAGLSGSQSFLFYDAIRIIGELRPSLAVWENVPNALSSNSGRDFASVLSAFRGIGANDVAWRVLDAQHFGVPQHRRRLFLVADFRGERAAEILFAPDVLCNHTGTNPRLWNNPAAASRSGPELVVCNVAQRTEGIRICPDALSPTLTRFMGTGGNNVPIILQGNLPLRKFTPLECERLMGFPDNWTANQSDTHRYRQLGNSVSPAVTDWLGSRIALALEQEKKTYHA